MVGLNQKTQELNNLSIDGGMVKNKFFLQIISDLLEIDLSIPELEEMSSYGALLFGIQHFHNIKNLEDLRNFRVKKSVIKPNANNIIKQSYASWKDIVDKHFQKNQE